ncbi:MAG: FecR domain-containing protein [Planctomycetes bacterium]|nr:FecR domain-containing protein [Planctomycetota bacterium]
MNISREVQTELLQLVGKLLDEQLSDGEKSRLSKLLHSDPAVAQYYLSLMAIHTELEWQHEEVPQSPAEVGEPRPGCLGQVERRPRQSALRGRSSGAAHGLPQAPAPHLKPQSNGLQLQTVLLLLAFLGISTITIWAISRYQVPSEQAVLPVPPKPVAELIRTVEARWAASTQITHPTHQQPLVDGAALYAGQELQLTQGTAEVRFSTGATVILQGPATFVVSPIPHSTLRIPPSQGFLSRGKLTAHVPEAGRGFRIRTPLAMVTDFGTRFVLSVDAAGENVSVSEGLVQFEPNNAAIARGELSPPVDAKPTPRAEPVLLRAGQEARIDTATGQVVRTSAEDYRKYVLSLNPDIYLPMERAEQALGARGQPDGESNQQSEIIHQNSAIHNLSSPDRPGMLHAEGTHAPFMSGRVGEALQFRGGQFGDYVQVPFEPSKQETFTFSAWVWLDPSTPSDRFIASDYWTTSRSGFGLAVNDKGQLYVAVAQMVQKVRSAPLTMSEDYAFPVGAWQQVAFVADRQSSTFTLYRNGQPVAMRNGVGLSIPWRPERPPLYIGVSAFGMTRPEQLRCWPGKIDEVAVWRRALSPDEITQLYNEASK